MQINNSKLLELLIIYHEQKGHGDSHQNVVTELLNGDSSLFLPSKNDSSEDGTPSTSDTKKAFSLTSIFDRDGIKALGAFTDEKGLAEWAKQPSQYLLLKSKDVLKFCEKNSIGRIVINIGLPTMFILEYNKVKKTS
jgi:hypothetical protein